MIQIRSKAVMELARKRGAYTQREVAELLDWDEGRLSRLLTGRGACGPKTLDRLCVVLGCQPGDILEHKQESK